MLKCYRLSIFYLIYKKLRSQQLWKYCDNNKCCNIFSKHLFLVVVGHSLIFYNFISTCKKLTRQWLWKHCEICYVSITIYILAYTNILKKKKKPKSITEKKEEKKTLGLQCQLNKVKALHNKCCNIFSKHLFLVVVGYSFVFYYFILTCKKWTRQ